MLHAPIIRTGEGPLTNSLGRQPAWRLVLQFGGLAGKTAAHRVAHVLDARRNADVDERALVLPDSAICREGVEMVAAVSPPFLLNHSIGSYRMVDNFLIACRDVFWSRADGDSFITRTVGIQAQLDILRLMAREAYETRSISVAYFKACLDPAGSVDFSLPEYRSASGAGRGSIRRAIADKVGLGGVRA